MTGPTDCQKDGKALESTTTWYNNIHQSVKDLQSTMRLVELWCLLGWLVVLRIYVILAVFKPYRDLEAEDNQSLKSKWRDRESNTGPLAPQAQSLIT